MQGLRGFNKVIKSHHIVGIVIIICILVFPITMTEKITVCALAPGSNHSSSSSFTAGMMQTTQEQHRQLLQSKIDIVKLLADMVENRLHQASVLLEITSVDPVVQKTPFAYSINKVYMGIQGNLDLQKRKIAQDILSKDRDFGSVYFTMPNGNIYR